MKKVLSLLMVCLLVTAFTAMAIVPASAASAKEDIVASLKEHISADLLNKHLPAVENILQQLEITDEQAAQVIECIEAADAAVGDLHYSLHGFTTEERVAIVEQLNKVCKILKMHYEIEVSEDPKHIGDDVAVFYKEDGTKLADVDFDVVRKTNTPIEMDVMYVVLAIVLMAGAVVAAFYAKKAVSAH